MVADCNNNMMGSPITDQGMCMAVMMMGLETLMTRGEDACEPVHQQNSTFATPSFDISHEQFSFYSQTWYVKSLFLIQRRFSEIFRQGL